MRKRDRSSKPAPKKLRMPHGQHIAHMAKGRRRIRDLNGELLAHKGNALQR
jgi:hypothetical protein